MKTENVKGFKDYANEEAIKRAEIRKILVDTFEKYGFEPVETPIIEYEEFVKGENEKDEAVSDIYKLKDKGGRKLALRYEPTFQLKRLMKGKKTPYKRYQIGEVFRDEPVKGNRTRQFTSCDIDVVGSTLKDQVSILEVVKAIIKELNIEAKIYFNNRKLLNEILEEQKIKVQNREEVIREIDKLDKLTESEVKKNLKKFNAEKILEIFKKDENYFRKYKSYSEIEELKKYCSYSGIKIIFVPYLARGLSYYNGTVFEVKTKKIKETIFGGGSYEFNNVQCFGFGVSIERLFLVSEINYNINKILIVSLNEDKKAIEIASKLRRLNNRVSIFYGKPSKALEYANSYNYNQVIFVGAKEVKQKKVKIKDMQTGKEKLVTLEKISKKNIILQRK